MWKIKHHNYILNDKGKICEFCIQRYTKEGHDDYVVAIFSDSTNRYKVLDKKHFNSIKKAYEYLEEYAEENGLRATEKERDRI